VERFIFSVRVQLPDTQVRGSKGAGSYTINYDVRAESWVAARDIAIASGLVKHSPDIRFWRPAFEGMTLRTLPEATS